MPLLRVVKNDTFRTLATDLTFKGKVREDMLIRLLEAFAWKSSHGQASQEYSGLPSNAYSEKKEKGRLEFAYVQGQSCVCTFEFAADNPLLRNERPLGSVPLYSSQRN